MSTEPTLASMIDHVLATHHGPAQIKLEELNQRVQGRNKPLTAPWRHLYETFTAHMMKEETILFPAIRSLESGDGGMDVSCAIGGMQYEHELLGTFEVTLRAAARDAGELEEPLLEFLDDLAVHAAFEDEVLFPAAMALQAKHSEAEEEEPECAPAPVRQVTSEPAKAAPKGLVGRIRGRVGRLLGRR